MSQDAQTAAFFTPGQLSQRSGMAISALHFYESQGLIQATRTAGNQRRYARDTLRRLAFIGAAQRVGISLQEIREALATLPAGRTPSVADWAELSARWCDQLDHKIATLQRLRDDLTGCIACGCLSLDTCALYNPGDQRAKGNKLLGAGG